MSIAHAQSNADSLFSIAYHFHDIHEYDSSIHYFNQMLQQASSNDSRASALNGIGVAYSAKGLPDRSISYYNQAISLYKELNDTAALITTSNNLAIIYKDKGLYENALDLSFDILPKLEKHSPDRTLASTYNTIGTVYARIQDYEHAYDFYRRSLTTRISIGYEQGVGQSYGNIGELFIEMKKYDSALSNLYKSVEIRKKINDSRGLGRMLTLIGNTLTQSGKAREALNQLIEAHLLARSSDDNIGEILAQQQLGVTYMSLGDFKNAEQSLSSAFSLIGKTHANDYLKRNLELQSDLYRKTGNTSKLINALDRLSIVKDSILNQEKIESLLALEIQYETEKKEQEILTLQQQSKLDKAELETRRLQIFALSAVSLLIGVITVLAYRVYKQTRKEKLSAQLHAKEVQHRMKNHLQILSSIFTIQAALLEDKQAQELVKSTEGRVTAMALLHKKLYNSGESATLSLKEYVIDLIDSIVFAHGFSENKLQLDRDIPAIELPVEKTIRIGLILNELITNALKYAYEDQPKPKLIVKISSNNNSIHLIIGDNGRRPVSSIDDTSGSFGLRMVRFIVKELKGTINLKNENGTKYLITIPE